MTGGDELRDAVLGSVAVAKDSWRALADGRLADEGLVKADLGTLFLAHDAYEKRKVGIKRIAAALMGAA